MMNSQPSTASSFAFGPKDRTCIDTIRVLACDMVQKANSGHPGAPMGCAPLTHVLFSRFFNCDPTAPHWAGRDRFVLSNGHACALQYSLLHLLGYDLTMDDLKAFRQLDSKTPGHPESHMTPGIEVTTGPLGQGFANAVGLAIAEQHMSATFNQPDRPLFDNFTYVLMGDGCMQEGISSEAASLAGHLQLSKLIVLYDDNHVSIDGDTELAFTENVDKRFEAYGFDVQFVKDGDNDLEGIARAIAAAQKTSTPSLIRIRTTIGFGSKHQATEKVHGAPLGAEELASVKRAFGMDPAVSFHVASEVTELYKEAASRGQAKHAAWQVALQSLKTTNPDLANELVRRLEGRLPTGWESKLPTYAANTAEVATRKLSENVLNAIADVVPELIGGSADLTGSNLTKWKTSVDFQKDGPLGRYAGRYIRFGVREHAMFGIMNGISAYGGFIPFGSTFLNFISYGLGAVRLSSLSQFQGIYIMTHDSIGLGEDGPTHQPIETLTSLRALPNMLVIRPADGNEVSAAYYSALTNRTRPSVLCLSRQNLPQLAGSDLTKPLKGAYILQDDAPSGAQPDVILIGTGSEVALCVKAAGILLTQHNLKARVVSMPCCELFDEQSLEYRNAVLSSGIPIISVEAASTLGWRKYAHVTLGIDSFGSSGPYKEVYAKYGLTGEEIARKAAVTIQFYSEQGIKPASPFQQPPF